MVLLKDLAGRPAGSSRPDCWPGLCVADVFSGVNNQNYVAFCQTAGNSTVKRPHKAGVNWLDARRSPAHAIVWTIALSVSMMGLVVTALGFHLFDFGTSVGFTRDDAGQFMAVMGMTALVVGLIGGFLIDFIPPRFALAVMLSAIAAHLSLLPWLDHGFWFYLPAMALGCATGLAGPVINTMQPRYFGRLHLGAINGAQWSAVVIASAIGPLLYALARDYVGSYHAVSWLLLPILVLLLTSALTIRPPAPASQ